MRWRESAFWRLDVTPRPLTKRLDSEPRKGRTMPIITISPEDFACYERISHDPFASNVHYVVYPTPVATDECVFRHEEHYLLCSGCEPDPYGDELWSHVHLVTVGSNGGMRCDAYGTLDALLNDLQYPRVRLDCVTDENGAIVAVALMDKNQYAAGSIPVSREVGAYLSTLPDERDSLVEGGLLFEEDTKDDS
jgi:hypothetical protein